jgi:hypothetical protein
VIGTNMNKLQIAALVGLFTEAADLLSEEERGFERGGASEYRHCSA